MTASSASTGRNSPRRSGGKPPASSASSSGSGSRVERRKAATREALLRAGRKMLADGTAATASIQEITDTADVGFGTFYNHFDGKPQLFEAAAEQVFEQWGEQLDRWKSASDDPAEIYAAAFRRSGRLLVTHSDEAKLIPYSGYHLLDSKIGLGPRARRDLSRAVEAGRFNIDDVAL